jgi:ubiquinone/menaquinone biosynthesis C-methylase UbiE
MLDFGCGDMEIASNIHQIIPEINWTGTDIHLKLDSENFPFKYLQYQDCKLPFQNKSFEIVVMSDVLHHIIEKE